MGDLLNHTVSNIIQHEGKNEHQKTQISENQFFRPVFPDEERFLFL